MLALRRTPKQHVVKVVARGMASEQEMRKKIESTKNLEKITKSMKMVAASRMRVDENKMLAAKPFTQMLTKIFTPPADFEAPEDAPAAAEDGENRELIIVNASDRGLCGGINSYVAKAARAKIEVYKKEGVPSHVVCIGEKGRSQMNRTHAKTIDYSIDEHCKAGITFGTCLSIADRIVDLEFANLTLIHNSFKSMIAYDQKEVHIKNMAAHTKAKRTGDPMVEDMCPAHLQQYEFEPEDRAEAVQNLFEFGVAGSIYGAIVDGNAAEQSARMQAMDNASKNASEMIDKYTLAYNRVRQAKITTELIEIISGAESLASGED